MCAEREVRDTLTAIQTEIEDLVACDTADNWGPWRPLPCSVWDPPDLPEVLIPEPLRAFAKDLGEGLSTYLAYVAVPLLVAAAGVVGRRLGLHPKRHDTWLEVGNLWGLVVGPPSSGKSGALHMALAPLRWREELEGKRFEGTRNDREAEREVLKIELQKARREAGRDSVDRHEVRARIAELVAASDRLDAVTRKRYIVNDSSMEMLGELERQNPQGLLIYRDELVGLLRQCDKRGNEAYRPFLLEGWNGTQSYTFDRIGRGTIQIAAHTLSIIGGAQPGVLQSYIRDATSGGEGNDGLLQRFGLSVWFDVPAAWVYHDRPGDEGAADRVYAVMEVLASDSLAHDEDSAGIGGIPTVHLSEEAQEFFETWLDDHMKRVRGREFAATPGFQAHLGKYPSLVARLSLLFHLIDWADRTGGRVPVEPVRIEAVSNAVAWVAYLEQHARKLYSVELDAPLEAARRLHERILDGDVMDGETVRSIYHHGWSMLGTRDAVVGALQVLAEYGIARIDRVRAKASDHSERGRPSDILRLHPDLRLS